jgi:threonine dehydrogenase-like Zn-dependent dehydrogenase
MRALHWDGHNLRVQEQHPVPQASDERALVRVRLAGVCSTDLQILKGYMAFQGIPGHEFVGEVHEGPTEWMGKRVVAEINFGCGRCEACERGMQRHCPARQVMGILDADGSFAEYLAVPLTNLHPVPDSVSDEAAVFTEPLAAAFEILEQISLQPGIQTVVLGDGKLGLLCAFVLHQAGAAVTIVGRHDPKLALARKAGMRAVNLSDWQSQAVDLVVEATGSPDGLQRALAAVRPRGTLVLKSTLAEDHTLSLAPLVINEVTVVGSRCGLFPPALEALAHNRIPVTALIEAAYPLAAGLQALNHAAQRGTRKVLLRAASGTD